MSAVVTETSASLLGEGLRIEGELHCEGVTRIRGRVRGTIRSAPESTLVLLETGWVEGDIHGEDVVIAGFVRGNVFASRCLTLAPTGRVIGNLVTARLNLEFGAYFEGSCSMDAKALGADTSFEVRI